MLRMREMDVLFFLPDNDLLQYLEKNSALRGIDNLYTVKGGFRIPIYYRGGAGKASYFFSGMMWSHGNVDHLMDMPPFTPQLLSYNLAIIARGRRCINLNTSVSEDTFQGTVQFHTDLEHVILYTNPSLSFRGHIEEISYAHARHLPLLMKITNEYADLQGHFIG